MVETAKSYLPQLANTLHLPNHIEPFSEVLEQELDDILKKYSMSIVAEDCLAMAKQDIGEIKKLRKSIKDRTKEIVDELQKPILEFKEKIKRLDLKCQEAEEEISKRIDFFKEREIESLREMLCVEINKELRRNFLDLELSKQIVVDDLLKAPSKCLTKGGVLTKLAKEEIEKRVEKLLHSLSNPQQEKSAKVSNNLAEKEKTQGSVEYLKVEQSIQTIQTPHTQKQQFQVDVVAEKAVEHSSEKNNSENKPKTRKLVAVFELEVSENVSNEKLAEMLRARLVEKGFKSLKSVSAF